MKLKLLLTSAVLALCVLGVSTLIVAGPQQAQTVSVQNTRLPVNQSLDQSPIQQTVETDQTIVTSTSRGDFMPRGNYGQTCRACRMNNGLLRCLCQNRNGFLRRTALFVPKRCRRVENINGHLRCVKFRRHHRIPRFVKRVDVKAGPIWNQGDANNKCPDVCDNVGGHWNGQWTTTKVGRQSVCHCVIRRRW